MAIIYSYPVVVPALGDLLLGTDSDAAGKPTKNFTVQSIVDILQAGATGLGAVLAISGDATNLPATNFSLLQVNGSVTANSFTDGVLNITGGNLTTTGNGTFNNITGTLQTAAQPNVTSLGILTSLRIGNAAPAVASIKTTMVSPGSDLALVTEKAIAAYIASTPNPETLAQTLLSGNLSGGVKDITMQGAVSNITFEDSPGTAQGRAVFGAGAGALRDLEIYHIGGAVDKSRIVNSSTTSGLEIRTTVGIDLMSTVANHFIGKFKPFAATNVSSIELFHNNLKKFVVPTLVTSNFLRLL